MVNNRHSRQSSTFQPYRDDESEPLMTDTERNQDGAGDASANTNANVNPNSNAHDGTNVAASDATPGGDDATNVTRDARTTDAGHPDAPLDETTTLEVEDESDPPTPRFMQDERALKRWRWVPYPVRRTGLAVAKWSHGPPNARPFRIRPLFPFIQEYPLHLTDRFLPKFKHRAWFLLGWCSIWLIAFALIKRQGNISTRIRGWGEPQNIYCGATYWGADNDCGLNGDDCRPFTASGFPFKCPAKCESYHVLNPRAVGAEEINYSTFVIGGGPDDRNASNTEPPTYRGDSFICQAAIHAGKVSNAQGGCGVVQLVGLRNYYTGSTSNGITTVGFNSTFPQSFQFVDGIDCATSDPRWSLLAMTLVFTTLLSLFTANAAVFFFTNFTAIFWTVGMALDAPTFNSTAALFSNILGQFLPAMFCAWVIYDKMGVRRTLHGLTAQIEKLILWLGPCWVGAMTNYTLDFIPIQRLTGHDLNAQPGAKAALAIIIIVLVVIVAGQVWFFRQEARFLKYIQLYALFIGGIIISLTLPNLDLRIHHYILALLLLPGTSMQTRPSLVYQGLLVGLFINGVARWGFASVLQTPAALQGDAPNGSELPTILPPVIHMANTTNETSTISFTWKPPQSTEFDGISILVNDVERFRSYFDDTTEPDPTNTFVWDRNATGGGDIAAPEYFRFAFMDGSTAGDYTKAGTWTAEGDWDDMKPGPSRVKARGLPEGEVMRRRR